MNRILLACPVGMSTSLLVANMKDAAQFRGDEVKIWAVSQDKATSELQEADVLLIGPQLRFLLDKFETLTREADIPMGIIDQKDYGRVDGKAVLEQALKLIDNYKK